MCSESLEGGTESRRFGKSSPPEIEDSRNADSFSTRLGKPSDFTGAGALNFGVYEMVALPLAIQSDRAAELN